jgi:hypothetical protein
VIHLEKIGQLALLDGLFEQVAIPQAVADEVKRTLPPKAFTRPLHVGCRRDPRPPLKGGPWIEDTLRDA